MLNFFRRRSLSRYLSDALDDPADGQDATRNPDKMVASRLKLLDLPNEIISHVLSFADPKTLRSWSRVCRQVNFLAEQFLYNSILVDDGTRAHGLADSIANRPSRAIWTRSLVVSTRFGQDGGVTRIPPLLPLMRNLQHLRLETPDCNSKPPEDRVQWVAIQDRYERVFENSSIVVPLGRPRYLPHLKTCTLHFVDGRTELYELSRYAMLFLHPSLKELTISCASTDFLEELLPQFQNDPSLQHVTPLEYLHLEEFDVHAPTLDVLLTFPRALKALKFSEAIRYTTGSGWHLRKHGDVLPSLFVNALWKNCAHTLEWLSLAMGHWRGVHQSMGLPDGHLDLTRFSRLRHVEFSLRTLDLIRTRPPCDHALHRRLPCTVESFKVFGIPLGTPRPFRTFRVAYFPLELCVVQKKAQHGLPNLTKLTYDYDYYKMDDTDSSSDDENDPDGVDPRSEHFHLTLAKQTLLSAARNSMDVYRRGGVSLEIFLVALPRGFIPPYLNNEKAPRRSRFWDSTTDRSPVHAPPRAVVAESPEASSD